MKREFLKAALFALSLFAPCQQLIGPAAAAAREAKVDRQRKKAPAKAEAAQKAKAIKEDSRRDYLAAAAQAAAKKIWLENQKIKFPKKPIYKNGGEPEYLASRVAYLNFIFRNYPSHQKALSDWLAKERNNVYVAWKDAQKKKRLAQQAAFALAKNHHPLANTAAAKRLSATLSKFGAAARPAAKPAASAWLIRSRQVAAALQRSAAKQTARPVVSWLSPARQTAHQPAASALAAAAAAKNAAESARVAKEAANRAAAAKNSAANATAANKARAEANARAAAESARMAKEAANRATAEKAAADATARAEAARIAKEAADKAAADAAARAETDRIAAADTAARAEAERIAAAERAAAAEAARVMTIDIPADLGVDIGNLPALSNIGLPPIDPPPPPPPAALIPPELQNSAPPPTIPPFTPPTWDKELPLLEFKEDDLKFDPKTPTINFEKVEPIPSPNIDVNSDEDKYNPKPWGKTPPEKHTPKAFSNKYKHKEFPEQYQPTPFQEFTPEAFTEKFIPNPPPTPPEKSIISEAIAVSPLPPDPIPLILDLLPIYKELVDKHQKIQQAIRDIHPVVNEKDILTNGQHLKSSAQPLLKKIDTKNIAPTNKKLPLNVAALKNLAPPSEAWEPFLATMNKNTLFSTPLNDIFNYFVRQNLALDPNRKLGGEFSPAMLMGQYKLAMANIILTNRIFQVFVAQVILGKINLETVSQNPVDDDQILYNSYQTYITNLSLQKDLHKIRARCSGMNFATKQEKIRTMYEGTWNLLHKSLELIKNRKSESVITLVFFDRMVQPDLLALEKKRLLAQMAEHNAIAYAAEPKKLSDDNNFTKNKKEKQASWLMENLNRHKQPVWDKPLNEEQWTEIINFKKNPNHFWKKINEQDSKLKDVQSEYSKSIYFNIIKTIKADIWDIGTALTTLSQKANQETYPRINDLLALIAQIQPNQIAFTPSLETDPIAKIFGADFGLIDAAAAHDIETLRAETKAKWDAKQQEQHTAQDVCQNIIHALNTNYQEYLDEGTKARLQDLNSTLKTLECVSLKEKLTSLEETVKAKIKEFEEKQKQANKDHKTSEEQRQLDLNKRRKEHEEKEVQKKKQWKAEKAKHDVSEELKKRNHSHRNDRHVLLEDQEAGRFNIEQEMGNEWEQLKARAATEAIAKYNAEVAAHFEQASATLQNAEKEKRDFIKMSWENRAKQLTIWHDMFLEQKKRLTMISDFAEMSGSNLQECITKSINPIYEKGKVSFQTLLGNIILVHPRYQPFDPRKGLRSQEYPGCVGLYKADCLTILGILTLKIAHALEFTNHIIEIIVNSVRHASENNLLSNGLSLINAAAADLNKFSEQVNAQIKKHQEAIDEFLAECGKYQTDLAAHQRLVAGIDLQNEELEDRGKIQNEEAVIWNELKGRAHLELEQNITRKNMLQTFGYQQKLSTLQTKHRAASYQFLAQLKQQNAERGNFKTLQAANLDKAITDLQSIIQILKSLLAGKSPAAASPNAKYTGPARGKRSSTPVAVLINQLTQDQKTTITTILQEAKGLLQACQENKTNMSEVQAILQAATQKLAGLNLTLHPESQRDDDQAKLRQANQEIALQNQQIQEIFATTKALLTQVNEVIAKFQALIADLPAQK